MKMRQILLAALCFVASMFAVLSASAQLVRQTAIKTLAGTGTAGYVAAQDGAAATLAQLNAPQGMTTDLVGHIYIADTANNRIRKIDALTGAITTVAGSGVAGYRAADENVQATFAQLNAPTDVIVDGNGTMYIADTGNHIVRKVVLSTGIITTFAGTAGSGATKYNGGDGGPCTQENLSQPVGLALGRDGGLFIADAGLNRVFYCVQYIGVVVGNGVGPYTTTALEENVRGPYVHISAPHGLAVDRAGNLYIADTGNKRIRVLPYNAFGAQTNVTTIAGDGTDYSAATEGSLATATGIGGVLTVRVDVVESFYFLTSAVNRVLKISAVDNKITTYAGTGAASFTDNVVTSAATVNAPLGLAINSAGTLFIGDTGNHRVRSIPVATGNLLFPQTTVGASDMSQTLNFTAKVGATLTTISVLMPTGQVPDFVLGTPVGCALGSPLVAGATCSIPVTFTPTKSGRRMAPVEIVTSKGKQRFAFSGMGAGSQVLFSPSIPVLFAGGNNGDGRGYTPAEDNGPALAAHLFIDIPKLDVDGADNLYVTDHNARIRKITPGGIITTVAGGGTAAYSAADEGASATSVNLYTFDAEVDAAGNIYLSDPVNGRIRKVDAATGKIASISSTVGGGTDIRLDQQGNVYITDPNNYNTFRVDADTGITSRMLNTTSYTDITLHCGPTCQGVLLVDDNGVLYSGSGRFEQNSVGRGSLPSSTETKAVIGSNARMGPNGGITSVASDFMHIGAYNIFSGVSTTVAGYTLAQNVYPLLYFNGVSYLDGPNYSILRTDSQAAQLDFMPAVQGQASPDSPLALFLFNVGGSPFTLYPPTSGQNPALTKDFQFSNSSTCPQLSGISSPTILAAGAGCTYNVNFLPTVSGAIAGSMVITDNQFSSATPVSQTMKFNGVATAGVVTTSLTLTGLVDAAAGTQQTITVTAFAGSAVATGYRGTINFSTSDTNPGVVPAAYTFTAADAGVHTFTVTLKKAGTGAFVSSKDTVSNALVGTSSLVTIRPLAAISIAPTQSSTPQSAFVNEQFFYNITAQVSDTYGNGVPGVTVNFAFPTTGASATFQPGTANPFQTDADGRTSQLIKANGTAGTYNVTATATGFATPATFVLTNKPPTLSISLVSTYTAGFYGQPNQLTAKILPGTINGKYPTGTVTFYEGATVIGTGTTYNNGQAATFTVFGASVGTHVYSLSYAGDGNYAPITKVDGPTITIAKADAGIGTAFSQTIVRPGTVNIYVGNNNAGQGATGFLFPTGPLNYTIGSVCGAGRPLTGTLAISATGAATFPIPADCPAGGLSLHLTYAGDSNYNAARPQDSAITVTAQTATITVTNTDQIYDGTPKSVTVTTVPAGVAYSVAYVGSSSGAPPTLGGLYPVQVRITNPNYTGSATSSLLIRRGPVPISWGKPDAIAYGTPLSTLQLGATTTVQGTFSFNPVSGTILTPGRYTLNVTFTPADSPTTPTTATVLLDVTKGSLTLKAVDAARLYGAADPVFTAVVTGALNGDVFSTGGATTATAASSAGTYPITPTITGQNLLFYDVTSINATLTISGTPAAITLSNLNQMFDGTPKSATVTTAPAGLAVDVTYGGSTTVPSAAGSYPVVATISDPNYKGTANGVLIITASTVVVTWNTPAAIAYGTALSPTQLNATTSAQGTFVYTPAAGTILLPGLQTLSVLFTPTSSSLLSATRTVQIVVNKAALTVTAADASRPFGVTNPALTATIVGVVNGDVLTASATTIATSASPVGNYAIVPAVAGVNAGAYNVTLVNATLTVGKAMSLVALTTNKPTTYVTDSVTFSATVSGPGGTPSGTVEFFNGSTSLGIQPLVGGSASVSTNTLAAGVYNITAVYSGDGTFLPSTSPIVVETIFSSDYTIVVNPTTLTIKRGDSGKATFTVTPTGNFHDTLNFACSSLPAYATCSFAPPSLAINGAPASTVVTIGTTANHVRLEQSEPPWQKTGSGVALAALFGFLFLRRRGRVLPVLLMLLMSLGVIAGLTGCGTDPTTTPTGAYTIHVNAGVRQVARIRSVSSSTLSTKHGGLRAIKRISRLLDCINSADPPSSRHGPACLMRR